MGWGKTPDIRWGIHQCLFNLFLASRHAIEGAESSRKCVLIIEKFLFSSILLLSAWVLSKDPVGSFMEQTVLMCRERLIYCSTCSRSFLRMGSLDSCGGSSCISLNSLETWFENRKIRGICHPCQDFLCFIEAEGQKWWLLGIWNKAMNRRQLAMRVACTGEASVMIRPIRVCLSPLRKWWQFSVTFQILWCLNDYMQCHLSCL